MALQALHMNQSLSRMKLPVINNQPDCRMTFTIIQNNNVFGCSARSVIFSICMCIELFSLFSHGKRSGDGRRPKVKLDRETWLR